MSHASPALTPSPAARTVRVVAVLYVTLLVAVPLTGVLLQALSDGGGTFIARLAAPITWQAIRLTLDTAVLVGAVNTLFGTVTAWVIVRQPAWRRTLLSALVDLPMAIPTLVAGVMLATLYGPESLLGRPLEAAGCQVVFARPGIILALAFVTLPFVVRAVEPVLLEVDRAEEEAAVTLGAGPLRTFATVYLPAAVPAALAGGIRSVARCLGEFGSVVIVAGNIPGRTLTAPVYVFGEIESGAPETAAAVATALLVAALGLSAAAFGVERAWGARHAR